MITSICLINKYKVAYSWLLNYPTNSLIILTGAWHATWHTNVNKYEKMSTLSETDVENEEEMIRLILLWKPSTLQSSFLSVLDTNGQLITWNQNNVSLLEIVDNQKCHVNLIKNILHHSFFVDFIYQFFSHFSFFGSQPCKHFFFSSVGFLFNVVTGSCILMLSVLSESQSHCKLGRADIWISLQFSCVVIFL